MQKYSCADCVSLLIRKIEKIPRNYDFNQDTGANCWLKQVLNYITRNMNSMQTCNSVTFCLMKNSFSDVSRKWILPNMIRAGSAIIIFGKINFLLTSENEFFMK